MNYILASASPRRQELIKLILSDFLCIPADIDETCDKSVKSHLRPQFLALKKAKYIQRDYKDDVVIGADTAVFLGNKMLGKPKDKEDAFNMLKSLSGKTHYVITGCAILKGEKEICFSVKTKVRFYKLSDSEIKAYVETGEPMDKAGAYGIQGKAATFVKYIKGDCQNVIGLPVATLKRKLAEIDA